MRFTLMIALVAGALALGACGGDGDSDQGTAPAQTSTTTTSPTTGRDSESKRKSRRSNRKRSRQSRSRGRSHPTGGSGLTGIDRAIYHESRARCQALPLPVAALRYRAPSREPGDVAEAYAERTYPSKRLQKGARLGCLAGLSGNR